MRFASISPISRLLAAAGLAIVAFIAPAPA